MTFNIRCADAPEGLLPRAPSWVERLPAALATIRQAAPDLLGLQEVTLEQLHDLAAGLPAYDWVGHGRDDGHEAGEFTPIFFRRDRLVPADSGTFWLSSTPEAPGEPAWGARLRRIVTWIRIGEGRAAWWLFNTHFDHESLTARLQSASLLLDRLRAAEGHVVVTGDFNCTPVMPAYRRLTALESGLRDARRVAARPEGPARTFHPLFDGRALARIDHLFVGAAVRVLRHQTLAAPIDGQYPSDHFPVVVDLHL